MAGWQSGYAAACKAVDAGSIPTPASKYYINIVLSPLARVVELVDTRDLIKFEHPVRNIWCEWSQIRGNLKHM